MTFPVLIWATSAIVANEVEDQQVDDHTKMFVAGLLSVCCVLLALRLLIVGYRQKVDPIGKTAPDETDQSSSHSTYGTIF